MLEGGNRQSWMCKGIRICIFREHHHSIFLLLVWWNVERGQLDLHVQPWRNINISEKGRSLNWDDGIAMNISTIITIGVLSALIVLSLIILIIIISHRKTTSEENARKISRSSTNQLIYDQVGLKDDEDYSVSDLDPAYLYWVLIAAHMWSDSVRWFEDSPPSGDRPWLHAWPLLLPKHGVPAQLLVSVASVSIKTATNIFYHFPIAAQHLLAQWFMIISG